ncbi:MAG: TIR domain-containing protein [Acidimicrobiales bacterium]
MPSAAEFDVFLSYNSADRAVVERLAERLRGQRLRPWLDQWHLTPGASWQPEIVSGLRACRTCAVMVGPSGLGDWAREELAVAQDRAAKDRDFRLFMVLLPGAPEPFDPSLAFLSTRTWVDLRDGSPGRDAFRDLVCAITGTPRRSLDPATDDGEVCPYRGLESYDEEHARFFFGRDDDILRIVEKCRTSRFLAVLGPSGSGKSSLVRAGGVPALREGAVHGSEGWSIRVLTPGAHPLSMLAAQLRRLFPEESMQRTVDAMRADERTLDLACSLGLADRPPGHRVLLVADQFEEVFTLCTDAEERAAFLANLLYAATIPGGRVAVVAAMRADFYHRCAPYPQLRALVAEEQFLVGPMSSDGMRMAIEEPAAMVGLELESGLTDTILGDVADRPGALPLLEYVLFELWLARRGRMLTLDAYVSMGGVEGALANRADAVYQAFTPAQQAIARRVLLRLTQPGEGTEDTRRRAALSELVTRPEERADVEAVVTTLADRRLLTASRDEVSGAGMVEITHEALIRGWPHLRRWINDDRDVLRAHRRLTEAAIEWDQSGRDEGLLYRGARLAAWQERDASDLNELEREFVAASREREARERGASRRRARTALAGLVVALVAISAVAVLALVQRNEAADERDVARSRELAASAAAQLPVDPERSLLLAIEAFAVRPTPQAEAILRQATLESRVRGRFAGHEGPVLAVSFSPDGRQVVSGSVDRTLRVWDVGSEAAPTVLEGHGAPVTAASFTRDGRRVLSAGADGTVRLWDRSGATPAVVLGGHQGPVNAVALSPDGRLAVSAGNDLTVRVWDVAGQREASSFAAPSPVLGIAFSADGRLLATAGADRTVRFWDPADGRQDLVLAGHEAPVSAVAFHPDGRVVSAGQDGTVRIWGRSGIDPRVLRGHKGRVNDAALSPDGARVASAGADGTIMVWDAASTDDPVVLRGHEAPVIRAAFSPDGRSVVSSSADGTVRVWDPARPGQDTVLRGHENLLYAVARTPDGRSVVTASVDRTVRAWDVSEGSARTIGSVNGPVHNVAVRADGSRAATVDGDGVVRLWDLDQPKEPVVLPGPPHQGPAWGVAFSPDGRLVASGGEDATVRIWDAAGGGDPVVGEGHTAQVFTVAFSPDGTLLASAGVDGMVRLWDVATADTRGVLQGHAGLIHSVAFSGAGDRLVTASDDTTVRIWDVGDRRQLAVLRGHQGSVWSATFVDDDRLVVSGGDDGIVRVWDAAGGRAGVELRGHAGAILDVDAGPGGTLLASAGQDATVRIWSCQVCGPIDEVGRLAQSRATRQLTPEERSTFLGEPPD